MAGIEFAPHPDILGTLAGEEEGDCLDPGVRITAQQAGYPFPLVNQCQFGQQLALISGNDGQPLVKMVTPQRRGITEIAQIQRGVILEVSDIALGQRPQCPLTLRRKRQQIAASCLPVSLSPCLLVSRCSSHNHMGIRAANAKGADPGNQGRRLLRPGLYGGWYGNRHLIPLDVRVGIGKMEMGRDLPIL